MAPPAHLTMTLPVAAAVEFVSAAAFASNVSLGTTILAGLLGVGTLVSIVYGAKWKVTAEAAITTAELWETNANGEKARAEALAHDKRQLQGQLDEQLALVLELSRRPDLTSHELHAAQRHDALIAAVGHLGDRLEHAITNGGAK